jgi:hypothetical protein
VTGDGFGKLVQAQKAADSHAGNTLELRGGKVIVRGTGLTDTEGPAGITGNVISGDIRSRTLGPGRIGTTGSVSFNLEYVPFNRGGGGMNPWTVYDGKSGVDLKGDKTPVWIIRNGVNDLAQNGELLGQCLCGNLF